MVAQPVPGQVGAPIPPDIGGERGLADLLQRFANPNVPAKVEHPPTGGGHLHDAGGEGADFQFLPRGRLAPRLDQRQPFPRPHFLEQQDLDLLRFAGACGPMARREHPGVVDDQKMLGAQEVGEIAEPEVFPPPALPPQDHHAGLVPLGGGVLGDQAVGKGEVEIVDFHKSAVRRAPPPLYFLGDMMVGSGALTPIQWNWAEKLAP